MWRKFFHWAASAPASSPAGSANLRVSREACSVVHHQRLVIFDAGRGLMYKANSAGAQIWEQLAKLTPLDEIADGLSRQYGIAPEQAASDVRRFVLELEQAGLVSASEN
jgi:hypothetical protein